MDKYICKVCFTIYYPEAGEPEEGIPPGTSFEQLPDSWTCTVCGSSKDNFELLPQERYEKLIHGY